MLLRVRSNVGTWKVSMDDFSSSSTVQDILLDAQFDAWKVVQPFSLDPSGKQPLCGNQSLQQQGIQHGTMVKKEERATEPVAKKKKLIAVTEEEGALEVAWGQCFRELVEYRQANGDCNVPQVYSVNPQLGRWVKTQRENKRKSTLVDEREDKLDSIGFDWGKEERVPLGVAWGQWFQLLVDYKLIYGDTIVPQGYSVSPQLGRWVKRQRDMKRNSALVDEREAQLEAIGFDWGKGEGVPHRGVPWGLRFQQLVDYKQTHGDCNVPQRYNVNRQLGRWVTVQRWMQRNATLVDEREAELTSIGFVWGNNASTMKTNPVAKATTRTTRNTRRMNAWQESQEEAFIDYEQPRLVRTTRRRNVSRVSYVGMD